jgi:hypothetical protein
MVSVHPSIHPSMSSGDKDQIYGEQSGDLIAGNKGEDRL